MRRSLAIAAGILWILVVVFVARAQTALSDYSFIIDITVQNATSTDYDDPIPVVMNTGNLSAGGFYNATGTDILFTDSSNDTIGGLPQGVTSTTSTWWWGGSVPGETTRTFRVFMGGPAATTSFPFHAGNTIVTVPDDASMDYTSSTSIAFTAEWYEFPATGEAFFVQKPFSYEAGLNQTTLFFRTFDVHTTTVNLVPTADITVAHAQQLCGGGDNFDCVDADDGARLVMPPPGSNPIEDHFDLSDFSDVFSAVETTTAIVSVTFEFEHAGVTGGPPFTSCSNTAFVRLRGSEETSGTFVCPDGVMTVRSKALANNPEGDPWTVGDLDNITVGITSTDTGDDQPEIDFVRVVVEYVAAEGTTWTDSTLVVNREYSIVLDYSNNGLGVGLWDIEIDGVAATQVGGISVDIVTNTIATSFGRDLDGRMAGIRLGTAPGDVDLALDFTNLVEGQVGTSTNGFVWTGTVADTSVPTLTATYVIVADNTFLTTTVFALQVVPPTAPAAAEITTVDSVGDPSVAILFVTSTQSSDNPILGALFDACTAGGIPCDAWWLILTTFLVGVGGSVTLSRFDSIPTVAAMSLPGFLVVALFGGYSPWVVAITGLWFLGMVPLLQFANKS